MMQCLVSDIVDIIIPSDCAIDSIYNEWHIRGNRLFLFDKPTITLTKSMLSCRDKYGKEHVYFLLPFEYGKLHKYDMDKLHKKLMGILDELHTQFLVH